MPAQEERLVTYVGCAFALKVSFKGQVPEFKKPDNKLISLENAFKIFGVKFSVILLFLFIFIF